MSKLNILAWATSSTTIQGFALIIGAISAAIGKQITWEAAFTAAVPGIILIGMPQTAGQKAVATQAASQAVAMNEAAKAEAPK